MRLLTALALAAGAAATRVGWNVGSVVVINDKWHQPGVDQTYWQLDRAIEAGAKTVRFGCSYWDFGTVTWNATGANTLRFNPFWDWIDARREIVKRAKGAGMKVLLSFPDIFEYPWWWSDDQKAWEAWSGAYADFLHAVLGNMGQWVDVIGVGNEMNFGRFAYTQLPKDYFQALWDAPTPEAAWAMEPPDYLVAYWAQYRQVMQFTKDVIGDIKPGLGLTTNTFGFPSHNMIVAAARFHAALNQGRVVETQYDLNFYPEPNKHWVPNVSAQIAKFREVVQAHGGADLPIGIEEFGYNTLQGPYPFSTIPGLLEELANTDRVEDIQIYHMQDNGGNPSDTESFFGTYDKNNNVKGELGQAILNKVKQLNAQA
jgi:hypothetical protein